MFCILAFYDNLYYLNNNAFYSLEPEIAISKLCHIYRSQALDDTQAIFWEMQKLVYTRNLYIAEIEIR